MLNVSRRTWADDHQVFLKRDTEIIKVAIASPCIPTQTIAEFFGLSRQAVGAILNRNGVHKMSAATAKRLRNKRRCDECGKSIQKSNVVGMCRACSAMAIPLTCDTCGVDYERTRGVLMGRIRHPLSKRHFYCSRGCFFKRRSKVAV